MRRFWLQLPSNVLLDPVIKSRVATFNFVKVLLHSLPEPANAFSVGHRALPTILHYEPFHNQLTKSRVRDLLKL
jgi:hypothetical protein